MNLTVTPTAKQGLEKLAKERELSISEFVEKIGRESLTIAEIHDFFNSENHFQDAVSAIQSLPVERCNELPKFSGAYALVDKHGQVLAGFASNLHDEFGYRLINYHFFPFSDNEQYDRRDKNKYIIFWLECLDKSILIHFKNSIKYTIQKLLIENSFIDWLNDEKN